ncbi:hypothetical protein LCGC14_0755120 [marine sediment metagenome]|uniref:ParB-like N-terminal domain-containing protein n=1 Tax=marine sediment metagenome TaxID=412755 RepID=A0A0F9T9X7_9ZZZZ
MSKKYNFLKRTDRGMFAKPTALYPGPNNPRTNFDPEKMAKLKKQIRENGGVKQPLLVRRRQNDQAGELEIFDGERRNRCVQELLHEGVDIQWVPVTIRQGSEAELMLEAATTDQGKEKLDFVDQTNLVRILTGYGVDVKTISTRLGVSDSWVRQRLELGGLEPPSQQALRCKEITLGKALKMSKMTFTEQVAELEKIRNRRANGTKKAGSVIARPGKKACREMADEILQQRQLYTADQVTMMFGWFNGDVTAEELREQIGTGVTTSSGVNVNAPVAAVH